MIHWQQYNDVEKIQLLDIVSAAKKLPRLAIEKDWWVTVVLMQFLKLNIRIYIHLKEELVFLKVGI